MINPFLKIAVLSAFTVVASFSPAFVYGLGHRGGPILLSILISLFTAPGLCLFLHELVFKKEIERWNYLKEKEYCEWQEEIEAEYSERKKYLDELRLK